MYDAFWKYGERIFLEQLVEEGRVRVGTIGHFRRLEAEDSEIGDAMEGVRHVRDPAGGVTRGLDNLSSFQRGFFGAVPPEAASTWVIEDCLFEERHEFRTASFTVSLILA
jgi:hypothetical protein